MNILRETSKYTSPSENLCFWAIVGSYYVPAFIIKHTLMLCNYVGEQAISLFAKNR